MRFKRMMDYDIKIDLERYEECEKIAYSQVICSKNRFNLASFHFIILMVILNGTRLISVNRDIFLTRRARSARSFYLLKFEDN